MGLLNFSNPESGTFWASVSGQKGIFAVNLVSQNLKVALLNFSNPGSGAFWASVSGDLGEI